MVIYGVALLSLCYIAGMFAGHVLGCLVGLNANVGGVGFAMLFLLLLFHFNILGKMSEDRRTRITEGISFWQNMYIPVVIAMAASQNVLKAFESGYMAIACGVTVTVVSMLFIPIINKFKV